MILGIKQANNANMIINIKERNDDSLVKASVGVGMSYSNKLSMTKTNQDNNCCNDIKR